MVNTIENRKEKALNNYNCYCVIVGYSELMSLEDKLLFIKNYPNEYKKIKNLSLRYTNLLYRSIGICSNKDKKQLKKELSI